MKNFVVKLKNINKDNRYLLIAILIFILCFLNNWYWDITTEYLFSYRLLIPIGIIFLVFNIFLVLTIIDLIKTKKKSSLVALSIYIIIPIFSIFFPFRECRVYLEMIL